MRPNAAFTNNNNNNNSNYRQEAFVPRRGRVAHMYVHTYIYIYTHSYIHVTTNHQPGSGHKHQYPEALAPQGTPSKSLTTASTPDPKRRSSCRNRQPTTRLHTCIHIYVHTNIHTFTHLPAGKVQGSRPRLVLQIPASALPGHRYVYIYMYIHTYSLSTVAAARRGDTTQTHRIPVLAAALCSCTLNTRQEAFVPHNRTLLHAEL